MKSDDNAQPLKNESSLALSRFSHELRNPISLLCCELQLLSASHPELTEYEEWARITDHLAYINALLDELSDYNNAGRIRPENTALTPYLETVFSAARATMKYLGIAFSVCIEPALPTLPLDPVKMRQALMNLIRNAQEALPASGGSIQITAKRIGPQVCISVTDNGCGISTEQLSRIFLPFVTFKSGGSGIGLAITREIVCAHGGYVEAESTPGQGSTFRVFLG